MGRYHTVNFNRYYVLDLYFSGSGRQETQRTISEDIKTFAINFVYFSRLYDGNVRQNFTNINKLDDLNLLLPR